MNEIRLGHYYKAKPQFTVLADHVGGVARCGNAVCPPLAYAMVWANFPEWRTVRIDTMEQFHEAVAV